VITYI